MNPLARRGRRIGRACTLAAASVLVLAPVPALASNGLNLVGFGAESLALGSADIAVARDANAVNINPAGLTQLTGKRFDGYLVPFWSYNVEHDDARNNNDAIDNPFGVLAGGAYAQQALRPDLVFGIGLFATGGTGVAYENLATAFGTRDEYSAVLGVTKIASGVGWKLSPRLSLGLGVNLTYASARQKVFPATSDAEAGFFGLRVDGADGISFNGRLGLQVRYSPTLTLGLSYASETDLKLRDGTATFNFEDLDPALGRVKYRRARIDGFALAQELGAGLAWQFKPRWLLAAEVNWLDWSHALRDATLRATRPENANAPAEVAFAQPLDHRDQYVMGLGLAYDWDDKTVLRVGVNVARNPIPPSTLTPTLNLTADGEVDFGFTRRLGGGWDVSSALQFQWPKREKYDNPDQPFGRAREDYGVAALTVQLGRSW